MVNNKTYNNVVNFLLRLGEYHEQISTTSVGDIYDINLEKMEKFPLMHINPTSVETGDSQLTYNFQVFIMDMVSEKSDWQTKQHELLTKLVDRENNEQEVFNQTLAICTDIISMLRHSSTTRPEDLTVVPREHFISMLATIAAFPCAPPSRNIFIRSPSWAWRITAPSSSYSSTEQ